ncbi:MAG: low-complexity tail membrane protein, partial [Pseudanabaena sp. ELA748]
MKSPNSHATPINKSLDEHPFIWGNIALLAGVPWLLALSMSGLAVGAPVFPAWFEIFLLGLPAIALVAWVQWQQPISPFSLWFVAKPIESLSDRERQILTLVKQNQNGWYVTGWMAIALSIVMSAIFCKIYIAAPLAQAIAPFPAGLRLFGIVWAEIFFVLSNVFLQAGISALRIKLTPESELSGLQPFAVEKIKNSFTNVGWRSPQILKFFEQEAIVDAPETREAFSSESVELVEDEVKAELVLSNPISEPEIDQLIDEPKIEISETSLDVEIIHSDDFEEVSAIGEADINTDDQHTEEIDFLDQLEISEIIAEEALIASLVISETIENIIETKAEIVDEESPLESVSEAELELQFVEPDRLVKEPEIETVPNVEFFEEIEEPENIQVFAD